ncbi:MAG: hypothetical protein RLZZ495_1347 [Pseudomonadota bacterium]|jgi:aspartyl protease family protein
MKRLSISFAMAAMLLSGHVGYVAAQSVTFTGLMGSKALLVVNGGRPKTLAVGETHQGITLVAIQPDNSALVEIAGKRHTLYMGDAPARVGDANKTSGNNRITLVAGKNNHFMVQGQINGKTVPMMVDTGASYVSLSAREANRIGLDFRSGKRGMMSSANGVVSAWQVKLTVSIGDIVINDVDGVVGEGDMPMVLLGNSFLNHFNMTRTKDDMVLEKRY